MAERVIEPRDVPLVSTVMEDPKPLKTPTCTITSKKDEQHLMRAVEFHGKKDVKVAVRPRPMITDPEDVILKVTTTCICGSDLHMYVGSMPGMKSGDVVGHEFMGIVEDVGPNVKNIKKGDRVVVAFDIACGKCAQCKMQNYSGCDTTNPSLEQEMLYHDRTCGMFGYSHLTGGWEGGQAEYARVPFADVNCLKAPPELPDERVVFLSDILSTAWHANELGQVGKGDNVAIWGAGPARVVLIDEVDYRLKFAAEKVKGVETINFKEKKPVDELRVMFPIGPDVAVDAVGVHYVRNPVHKVEVGIGLETDSSEVVNELIYAVRKGGRISIVGAYAGFANHFNLGAFMEKGLMMAAGQTPVQKYWPTLLPLVQSGKLDPTIVTTHVFPLSKAPEAYRIFNNKEDNCMKVILKPQMDPGEVSNQSSSITERMRNLATGTVQTVQSVAGVTSTDANK